MSFGDGEKDHVVEGTVMIRALFILVTALLSIGGFQVAWAQPFPTKPIRFVLGFPPGTAPDVLARFLANEISKRLGQPILPEYKPGANGTIAAKYVVGATADGNTYFFGAVNSPHPIFNKNNAVDIPKELAPVAQMTTTPWILVGRAGLSANSISELVALGKATLSGLRYGTQSPAVNLVMALFRHRAGLAAEPIPYKGSPQILVALLAGEVDLASSTASTYVPQIDAGKLRAYLVMAHKRYSLLPAVPTAVEVGLNDLDISVTNGLWAPIGTPRPTIARMTAEVAAVLRDPTVGEQLRLKFGVEASPTGPDEQLRNAHAEMKLWHDAARMTNFHPE